MLMSPGEQAIMDRHEAKLKVCSINAFFARPHTPWWRQKAGVFPLLLDVLFSGQKDCFRYG